MRKTIAGLEADIVELNKMLTNALEEDERQRSEVSRLYARIGELEA